MSIMMTPDRCRKGMNSIDDMFGDFGTFAPGNLVQELSKNTAIQ